MLIVNMNKLFIIIALLLLTTKSFAACSEACINFGYDDIFLPCRDDGSCCGDGTIQGGAGETCEYPSADCDQFCHLIPCSIDTISTVAPDANCNGVADSAFASSTTVSDTECAVFQVCVHNTGFQDVTGIHVNPGLTGISNDVNYGMVGAGATTCLEYPTDVPASGHLQCTDYDGTTTASIISGTCDLSSTSACSQSGSICSDQSGLTCSSTARRRSFLVS